MLHFVMLYHFARMVKLLYTGLEVAHESSCTMTGNILIPMKTLYVPLEIKSPVEAVTVNHPLGMLKPSSTGYMIASLSAQCYYCYPSLKVASCDAQLMHVFASKRVVGAEIVISFSISRIQFKFRLLARKHSFYSGSRESGTILAS